MNAFDLAGGLVLAVSILIGWLRGGVREVASLVMLGVSAAAALFALRYSGPLARHLIHTHWLANVAALLVVFFTVYILLSVIVGAVSHGLRQNAGLGGVDRTLGAGFGAVRALVILGLANLALTAITPAERMPDWISGAFLYPVSAASAHALKGFAPQGEQIARRIAPAMGKALAGFAGESEAQTRDYDVHPRDALTVRVEKAP